MASRNLARGGSQEHENAEARLQNARERRDAVETRHETAKASDAGAAFEASVALQVAQEQVAAREAWLRWTERDY